MDTTSVGSSPVDALAVCRVGGFGGTFFGGGPVVFATSGAELPSYQGELGQSFLGN